MTPMPMSLKQLVASANDAWQIFEEIEEREDREAADTAYAEYVKHERALLEWLNGHHAVWWTRLPEGVSALLAGAHMAGVCANDSI